MGIGPMSNLADLLAAHPDLAPNLEVTLMGGALRYRHPDRAEHNIRLDVDAARSVLAAGLRPWLVPSDVTFTPENELTRESAEYQLLAGDEVPAWAAILREHLDCWFADFHPGTMQHDAMALSVAMRLPFLDVDQTRVRLDAIGRLHEDPDGHEVLLARTAGYATFRAWLSARLADQLQFA